MIYGVFISDAGTTGNVVEGDFIGTDASGTQALGNAQSGVMIQNRATNNTIGGTSAGAGDVISGNGEIGIFVLASSSLVEGNLIGTNAAGTRRRA